MIATGGASRLFCAGFASFLSLEADLDKALWSKGYGPVSYVRLDPEEN